MISGEKEFGRATRAGITTSASADLIGVSLTKRKKEKKEKIKKVVHFNKILKVLKN